jgi:RND superfamily putative drug exporter
MTSGLVGREAGLIMRTPSTTAITTAIAAASLRHKPLVIVAWLILALAGACTAGLAIKNMTYSYATPGQPGYQANQDLMARFGIDPTIEPTIAVLRLPPGESMRTAHGQRIAAETFAVAPKAGIVAVADYATTGNPRLISADGRSTWALINMPNPDKGPGVGVVDRLAPVLTAAAPRGVSVTVTGFAQLLANGGGSGGVPLLMAVPAILVTFLCVLGLTRVTDISYFLQYLVPLLGLGVAVDYSLLIVVRWRADRHRSGRPGVRGS